MAIRKSVKVLQVETGLTPARARRLVSQIASESVNVLFTAHARKRMIQRNVLPSQVIQVLLKGDVDEPAYQEIDGTWKVRLRRLVSGDNIRVVAALSFQRGQQVIVITVIR